MTSLGVLVAPDKFKGSLSARDVTEELCTGIREAHPGLHCYGIPMADGGDGTVEAFVAAGWRRQTVDTVEARGLSVAADVAWRESTAVVELANVCGIAMLNGALIPWEATTRGLGVAMRALVRQGARHVIVGLGGSASTDGGCGLLSGLGYRVIDAQGRDVEPGLRGLALAHRVIPPDDLAELEGTRWSVLTDVHAPLCGPLGAALQFGPQKGLDQGEAVMADEILARWSLAIKDATGVDVQEIPGAGAAGGAGAALAAFLDARLHPGAAYVAELCGVPLRLTSAAAVVTGEGRVDASSSHGKVPGVLAAMAACESLPAYVVAGAFGEGAPDDLRARGISLELLAGSRDEAMRHPRPLLREAGRLIGADLLAGSPGWSVRP